MTPTTLTTCEPGFILWCPTFGPVDAKGNPEGLTFQLDPSDPLADAEAGAEAEKVWGHLHKVAAPGDTVAICRVPESEEDVAVGKPRCFAGLKLVRGTVETTEVKLAVPGETFSWDGKRAHKL